MWIVVQTLGLVRPLAVIGDSGSFSPVRAVLDMSLNESLFSPCQCIHVGCELQYVLRSVFSGADLILSLKYVLYLLGCYTLNNLISVDGYLH